MHTPATISCRRFRLRPVAAALIGILAAGMSAHSAQAATLTWSGGNVVGSAWNDSTNFFGTYVSNWSSHTPPVNGDSLIFAGTNTTNTNTFSNLSVSGLSFAANAGAFTLTGNALGLTGNIINNSGNLQTINLPLNLTSHSTWDGGEPGMLLNGKVTPGNYNLTLKNKVEIVNAGNDFIVGSNGSAMLTLQSASKLSNATAYVGKDAAGRGEVLVEDANSEWNSSGNLYVGSSGRGSLTIQNGGQVRNAQGYLGYFGASQGTALVTGAGSRWTSALDLKVGVVGAGRLDIEAGGEVLNQSGYLGYSSGGGYGLVNVGGASSRWANSANLTVGLGGDAMLNVTTGGSVEVGNVLNIGAKGILNLDGGTLIAGAAVLGAGGKFNWNSGTLVLGSGNVGMAGSLIGNSVTLKAGKTLDIGNAFDIGASGSVSLDGGKLKVGTGNLGTGGQFNWISGTLGLKSASLGAAGSLLGNTVNLNGNQLLELGTLTLNAGSSLKLSDRNIANTHNLINSGKTALVFNGGSFHLNDNYVLLASLSGQGSVVLGGDAGWSGFAGYLELASDLDSTFAGSISGVGRLYKNGAGTVTLSGNSAFDATYAEQGVLKFASGARVRLGGSSTGFAAGTQGTLVVDNAVMDNTYFTYVGYQGNGTLNIINGGRVYGDSGDIGYRSTGNGQVTIAGADSTWAITRGLVVGVDGRGTLDVNSGGVVTIGETLAVGKSGAVNLNGGSLVAQTATKAVGGAFNWNSGTLKLAALSVGDAAGLYGSALTLAQSQVLDVGALTLGSLGELNLAGGKVIATTASKQAGGQFDWSGGTLNISGNGGASLGHDSLLDAVTLVGSGKLLDVTHTLALDADALLVLQGSGRVKAGSLALTGGMVKAGSLNFNDIAGITGYGTVAGNVTGGNAANTIHAIGLGTFNNLGTFTLGNANSVSGYDFNGVLKVSNRVILLDKDQADLGVSTHLTRGARIEAGMGLRLGAGETLTFSGDSSILGNFKNDGSVSGTNGTLNLLSDVSGAGSFSGNVAFHAAYKPGNSPAEVDFQGGNATFDASSVLTMEIFGLTPGTEYDRLTGINQLSFNGQLHLVFANGFAPAAGSSFDLFDFVALSGGFDPDRISVTGYDREQLDFSRLASEGRLSVITTPVPEAETYAMFLIGLGLLGLRRRSSGK